jgi:hypothetical protein
VTRGARRLRLACALCALLAACATSRPPVVDFSEATKNYRNDDYPASFEAWTRHAKLVQDIGTAMEIWATFKSWDFRQAYAAKYAKVYDLADNERDQLAKSQQETARAVYEIHLVAQSTADRWNDLDRRTSPWRITLLDGTGAELAPISIKVEKLPELYEYEFFPTRTLFSKTYTIRFVRPEGAGETFLGPQSGRMILRVASPIGKVEVAWEANDSGGVR